jgi:hypothetical protein
VRAADAAGNLGPFSNIADATTPGVEFLNETVVQNLDFVTTMRFLPNGAMLMGEIGGTIRLVPPGANEPNSTPFNNLNNLPLFLTEHGERFPNGAA